MRNSITKLAVAAAIIVVSLAGIYCFFGSTDGTTIAWADVVENIRQCKSVTWKQIDLTSEPPTVLSEFWVLEPYYRYGRPDGTITVEDSSEGTVTFIYPDKNQAIIAPQSVPTDYSFIYDAFMGLKDQHGLVIEPMGGSEIDGKEVVGFYIEHEYDPHNFKDPMHLWVDPQTELPIRLDFLKESGGELVPVGALIGITFDEQFDESFFRPDLDGYEISQAPGVLNSVALHSIENASHVEEPDSNRINFDDVEESDPNTINWASIDEMDMGEHEE